MRELNTFVVHCSATRSSQDIDVNQIREMHLQRGWSDIGYHFVIKRDGTLEVGRPISRAGAHVKGHNANSVGVCLVGGLNEETGKPENNFTKAQFDQLEELIETFLQVYPSIEKVCGHRDLSPDLDGDGVVEQHEWLKQCPCFDVREKFNVLLNGLAEAS